MVDNDQNVEYRGNLAEAYAEAEEKLGIRVIEIGYLPPKMKFYSLTIEDGQAIFLFEYGEKILHAVQIKKTIETSVAVKTERSNCGAVQNKWLNMNIEYSSSTTETGQTEYEALLLYENEIYHIFGIVEEEEFVEILKNLSFY